MDNLKEKAKIAFIWDFFGKIARSGMGFVISIFLARLLEPSEFGLIAMVMVIIGIAEIFTDVGLGGALIQRRRVLPIHYSSVFYFNIFIASLLSLIIYFSASQIADFYNNTELIPLAEVMSVAFILSALSSVQSVKLRKELNYKIINKMSLISAFTSGVVGVLLAFYGAGVWSLVTQNLLQGIIYNVLIWSTAHWKPSLQFSFKALLHLWGFGFRMFLTGLIDNVFTRLDYMIIGKLFDATSLGFYQRAKSLNLFVIRYSSESLMSILFPVLSKVQNNLLRFQQIVIKGFGIINFVTFLLLGVLYLVSEELIVLLFGDKWLPSVYIFKILVLSGFVRPIGALLMNILMSRGKSKIVLRMAIYKVLIAFINFGVLYIWGMDAFLYGLIVVGLWDLFLNILFASREIKLSFIIFAKPFVVQASIAIFVVIFTNLITENLNQINIIMLMIKGSIFTFVYILINYLMNTGSYIYFLEQIMPMFRKRIHR
ncbi:lipopolysaccharide biosynthesis protein [Sulfurovum sp. TSL6]|uniref:lipopolysaccharide biosynthesis protein n=1 Tax=Sulfurovum sp. TSL6 TaxID=2826995 RepID=UPI001CC6B68A|nr:lipopolysaccharide biosynthesis protein [Sulfurovum sp. TSL6]GIU00479.1 lipopolysaccharide biosynthesis protein [Sulfurovum sp. TSL6]